MSNFKFKEVLPRGGGGGDASVVGTWKFRELLTSFGKQYDDNNVGTFELPVKAYVTFDGAQNSVTSLGIIIDESGDVLVLAALNSDVDFLAELYVDGSFAEGWDDRTIEFLEEPQDADLVSWIKSNASKQADGASIKIDATLTKSGFAADAKAVGDALSIKYEKLHFTNHGIITSDGTVDSSALASGKAHTDIIPISRLANGPDGHCVQDFDDFTSYPKVVFFSGGTLDTFIRGYTRDEFGNKDVLTVAEIKELAPSNANYVAFNSDYEEEAAEDYVYVIKDSITTDVTLTQVGVPADAKAVGDAIAKLSAEGVVGTWVFDKGAVPTNSDRFYVSFVSNGTTYTYIDVVDPYIYYGTTQVYGGSSGWMNSAYKTITITEAPTDQDFIAWLRENATKQASGGMSIKKIEFTDRPTAQNWFVENSGKVLRTEFELLDQRGSFTNVTMIPEYDIPSATFTHFLYELDNGNVSINAIELRISQNGVRYSGGTLGSVPEEMEIPDEHWAFGVKVTVYYID